MSNPKVYAPEFTPRWGSREGEAEADVRVQSMGEDKHSKNN